MTSRPQNIGIRTAIVTGSRALGIAAVVSIIVVIAFMDNPRISIVGNSGGINKVHLLEAFVASITRVSVAGTLGACTALAAGAIWVAIKPSKPTILLSIALVLAITPPPIWLTVCIMLFGLGEMTVIAAMMVSCVFLSVAVVTAELSKIEKREWFLADQLGMGWLSRLAYVVGPYSRSLADIVFRVGYVVSWISVVQAESSGVQSGLGAILLFGRQVFDWEIIAIAWALIVVGAFVTNSVVSAVPALVGKVKGVYTR